MNSFQNKDIFSKQNRIIINCMKSPTNVSDFLTTIFKVVQRQGFEDVVLDLRNIKSVFPNACVPIVSIINYYRNELKVDVSCEKTPLFLGKVNFDQPLLASKQSLKDNFDSTNRVWKFSDTYGVSALTNFYVQFLKERLECNQGVLEAFEWCLNEMMDNVLQHSKVSEGFIMAQVHAESHKVAICLSDTGVGIFNTLRQSVYKPRNAVDAITFSVKEGVTRDSKEHQGNGLWGLLEIVKENAGRLTITSGKGSLFFNEGRAKTYSNLPFLNDKYQGTIVDFQINTDSPLSVSKALGGHTPINLRMELSENDSGEHIILVRDNSHGTGTRKAAVQLRNIIINTINEGASKIIIDFQEIGVISSSFADELIGKLVVRFGFFNFQSLITLKNMTETVQYILHRSVAQRMAESLQSNNNLIDENSE